MNYSEYALSEVLQELIQRAVAQAVHEAAHNSSSYRRIAAESAAFGDGVYVNDDWQQFALFDEDNGFDDENRGFSP